jgi:NAD(P)-dependent dehydrogenase (short-subunit alcohol dehydrogenase family)
MKTRAVIVTGATGALGTRVAKRFAERGDNLVLLSHDQSKLDVLTNDLKLPDARVLTGAADLADAEAVRSLAEAVSKKFGSVHALIHLVGGWTGGKTIPETPHSDLDFMLSQHVHTTFNLFQAFSKSLSSNNWGRVIVVSASTVPNPPGKSSAYAAAKAAQENLVLSLIAELKGTGVTGNIIQVKAIDVENKGTGTTPAEIAAAIEYLFSEEASKVNGARIPLY